MDTIANRCKIIKKIRNNQIKSDINASTVGEKLLMDIFPAIDGFFIASCDFSSTELKMVLVSTVTHAFCDLESATPFSYAKTPAESLERLRSSSLQ